MPKPQQSNNAMQNNAEETTRIKLRQCKYLNNIVEQDHRLIKRISKLMLGFKECLCAHATLAGIELVRMLKKKGKCLAKLECQKLRPSCSMVWQGRAIVCAAFLQLPFQLATQPYKLLTMRWETGKLKVITQALTPEYPIQSEQYMRGSCL